MPRSQGNVVLRESAGLGGNINYIDVGFVKSFGFETRGALNDGADEIIRRAGTNHLNARGGTARRARTSPHSCRWYKRRMAKGALIPLERIEHAILVLRGHRVMLDADLAALYQVPVKRLNEQVARNRKRFPEDFMFQLSEEEDANLRSQFATSRSWGGRRTAPYAFTEQGVAMLSSVLRSPRAVQVNIEIMRAFVRLRRILQTNADLAKKLDALEAKYDGQFKVVFQAIRELMSPPEQPRRKIGYTTAQDR